MLLSLIVRKLPHVLLLVVLLGVGVIALWHLRDLEQASSHPEVEALPAAPADVRPDDSDVERPSPKWRPRDPNQPESLLDDLRSPHTTPANDVRLLALLFSDYASVFKRVPLGMHQEIVAALRGDNPRSIKYIPDGHPAVNANNEITDRWNKPFFLSCHF